MPVSTLNTATCLTCSCVNTRRTAAPSCWPPMSTTGPRRWLAGRSPSPAARSSLLRPRPRRPPRSRPMWRDAVLVAGKDLRIEGHSRVTTNQVAPFAVLVLVLFAFALDPDRGVLTKAAAGLFWVAVLFSSLLAVQRSFAVEAGDAARDGLRLSGLDPAGIFLGKSAAVAVQLVGLELLLGLGIVVLYNADLHGPLLLVAPCVAASIGLAAAGTVYGVLAAGLKVQETLLPLLTLPALAPVLLAATRAWEVALGQSVDDGWKWVELLTVFSIVYVAAGVLGFGPLLEES